MVTISKGLALLLAESELVNHTFESWLVTEGFTTVELYALISPSEALLEDTLIKPAQSGAVVFANGGEKSKAKWLWKVCRQAMERGDGVTQCVDDSKPIGAIQYQTIKKAWKSRHHFDWTSFRVLANVIMGKMHKHATATPKQFFIIFPEEMKLKSSTTKTEDGTLALKAGQVPIQTIQDIEQVTGIAALEEKIEAQFNTWAFVSILDHSWFSLQDVIIFMDIIKDAFKRRYKNGARPPLEFYVRAYVKTMQYFQDVVSTFEQPLREATRNTSAWIHVWTSWDSTGASASPVEQTPYEKSHKEKDSVPIEQAVQVQMNRLNQMAANIGKKLKGQGKGSNPYYGYGKGNKNGGWNTQFQGGGGKPKGEWKGQKGAKGTKNKFKNGKGKKKGAKW